MDDVNAYIELIKDNIEYEHHMKCDDWQNKALYEELFEVICEVVCVKRTTIRIAGEDYHYELVRSKFLKLNSGHLEYVIGCMHDTNTKITNIKAYMVTALYNAPSTINHYYQQEVQHDMYGGGWYEKVLFKIIIPLVVLGVWALTCYLVCNKADGFDYLLYWILVGCPYGIRKMCTFLVPKNFGIAGSIGILALNCIVGGLIGGIIVLVRIIVIITEIIKVIAGHFQNTMSKGVKEKRATKKALSINHKQYLYLSSGTYSIIASIRQSSI